MKKNSRSQADNGEAVTIVPAEVLVDRLNQIRGLIAQRAYELYEKRGMTAGKDVDDWLKAEGEVVHWCRHDLRESKEVIVLRAEIPSSYEASQLQVSVEPGRLMVNGEKEVEVSYWDGQKTQTEPRPQRIFRVHDLPAEIDPSRVTAVLKDEVLIVTIPKVSPASAKAQAAASVG